MGCALGQSSCPAQLKPPRSAFKHSDTSSCLCAWAIATAYVPTAGGKSAQRGFALRGMMAGRVDAMTAELRNLDPLADYACLRSAADFITSNGFCSACELKDACTEDLCEFDSLSNDVAVQVKRLLRLAERLVPGSRIANRAVKATGPRPPPGPPPHWYSLACASLRRAGARASLITGHLLAYR